MNPKYPQIEIKEPTGYGKSQVLAGRCSHAMRTAKFPKSEIAAFNKEFTGNWEKRLKIAKKWFTII